MRKLLLTTVSTLAFAVPTMAADLIEPTVFDWTGAYAGLNAGASFFTEDLELSHTVPAALVSDHGSDTDATFGVQAGYSLQTDSLLLGIEADFNYLDAGEDLDLLNGKSRSTWESDHDWFATIRARAGLVSDQTLFYITGGVAFLDSTYELTDTFFAASEKSDDVLVGWTIGGGIEHAFSEDWSAKIEYLYADFESVDESAPNFGTVTGSADPSLHVGRVGLNYHF